MKRTFLFPFLLVAFLLSSSPRASAQVATGIKPFNSYGGGPFDSVNLGNLNVHFDIPVISKGGRGMNLTYALGYDNSIWYPYGAVWTPVLGWGWRGETEAAVGYVSYSASLVKCFTSGGSWYWADIYSHFVYHDKRGGSHSFSLPNISNCSRYGVPGANATTTDGSGFQISAGIGSASITDRGGNLFYPPMQSGSGPATAYDDNGNEISFNGTTFTDTLGTSALTISGTNPVKFTYTGPSGGSPAYSVNYANYTVRTNFGCSGIAEFGPLTESLVSSIGLPDGTSYTITYEATPGYSGDVTGRIKSIELPTGGTITYAYSGSNNGITCGDGSTATLERTTPDGAWTYAHSESGTAWTTLITDPQNNQTSMSFQSTYETERQAYQGSTSGTLLKTTLTCYNGNTTSCSTTSVSSPITQRTVFVELPGVSNLESRTDAFYNTYGLVTEVDEYGYGSGTPGGLQRKTLTTFASLGNDIQNRPASVTTKDGSGNTKSQTTYTYDQGSVTATSGTPQHVGISGSRGNPTTVSYLVSGSTTLSKTYTYYDTGNVNVATDVNNAQTTYAYGSGSCGNSFVTSVSEPLGLSTTMVWNCTGGVETSITDENSKTTSYTYNDQYFWRLNAVTDPASNVENIAYSGATSVETSLNFNGSISTVDVLTTVDGIGRQHISQTKEGPSSSTYDSVETDYDSLGRPDRTTLPYAGTAGQSNSLAPSTNKTYDPLGRKTQVTNAGGLSTTFTYSQDDTYRTVGPAPSGENTKRKQFEYDSMGRLTSVCEVTSATGSGTCGQTSTVTGFWTQYTYDVLDDLTGVTQNSQSSSSQSRSYTYDGLGRMTSETNPESGNAPYTYTYDSDSTCGNSSGDLVKKVDAVGNTICYTYDALHRATSTFVTSGAYSSSTPKKYFVYDSATVNSAAMVNAKSRLAEAYTCISSCTTKITDLGFSYTARGEISDVYESTPNSGGYYHTSATYWANGALSQLGNNIATLPAFNFGPDGEGRISTVSASAGQNPVSGTTYNVASEPTQVNLGSSDSDSFTYYPNTDRMKTYSFNVNAQSVVGTLTWNAIGTLESLSITDPFNSSDAQSCSYSHDDLVRIASVNCLPGPVWSQTFTNDVFGNLMKSGTNSFQPTYSYLTNRMTQIGSSYPTYDANGNVTYDSINTYAWDAAGKPVTIDGVGVTYDALGRMVERNVSGAYSQVVYTPTGAKLAIMNGQTLQRAFVPLTGGSMAVYNSSGLAYYRHSDWLGSSRFASTPTRTMYYDGAYGPYGESYAPAGTTDLSFTGMNQDTVTGLYDFPAREYGIQGRWPSPDPAGLSSVVTGDPQTWNRYAYVRNNPLHLVDPSGMGECANDPCGDNPLSGGGGGPYTEGGYCPPDYDYCGDSPFGDSGGGQVGEGPPGPPPTALGTSIPWQNPFTGQDEGGAATTVGTFCVAQPEICGAFCAANPEICVGIVLISVVYVAVQVHDIHEGVKNGTITLPTVPHIHLSKKADTAQADAAWTKIKAICASRGVQLNEGHRERWHDKEVTKRGLKGFEELVKAGVDAFCPTAE